MYLVLQLIFAHYWSECYNNYYNTTIITVCYKRTHYLIFQITGLNPPVLNGFNEVDENTIIVFWTDNGCTPDDVEYVVSVTNSNYVDPMEYRAKQLNITLSVVMGINYTISVSTELCGGNITSDSSDLLLYSQGM